MSKANYLNLSKVKLIENALRENPDLKLTPEGALVVTTGQFTGRAVDDKYIVVEAYSERVIDFNSSIKKMSSETFSVLKQMVISAIEQAPSTYTTEVSAGANPKYSLKVKLISPSAIHSLFATTIFRNKNDDANLGLFTIIHHPDFLADKEKLQTRSGTVIVTNFETKEIIICGTGYAGEIKKSIFSVMNTLLPDLGVLPMHTGSNIDQHGNSSLFFGLSGTGKTTLSTDTDVFMIGDDEHGLSDEGIFNFEGGCYAKTIGLSASREPEIFKSANSFGAILENVVVNESTHKPDFDDKTLTENGRATYALTSLDSFIPSGMGPVPNNIFFLSADALGVLPAISRLNAEQAMYYFLSGYTAKLAGTEIGLKGIKTTFSHCFGAPFMMRKSHDYGNLLKDYLKKYPIDVWLVNTGWFGGVYGTGERYKLSFTRDCIRSVQAGHGKSCAFTIDPIFNLEIPKTLGSANPEWLNPRQLWKDQNEYDKVATDLKRQFDENYAKLK
jgi:phosphoenolpyruvate carboxykinase (ATP)